MGRELFCPFLSSSLSVELEERLGIEGEELEVVFTEPGWPGERCL